MMKKIYLTIVVYILCLCHYDISSVYARPLPYPVGFDGMAFRVETNYDVTFLSTSNSNLVVPEKVNNYNVTKIGNSSCNGNKTLESVFLPDTITSIGSYSFYSAENLKKINLPDSITSIGAYAFNSCKSLTNIIVPQNVTCIEKYTFTDCSNLTTIALPANLKKIEVGVFSKCNNLSKIYFQGSKSEWENIEINQQNDALLNAEIVYNANTMTCYNETNKYFSCFPCWLKENCFIIFVCYNGDKMVYVNPYVYAGETTIPFTTTETYDKVKVMVWENLETCMPLCEAEDVPLN